MRPGRNGLLCGLVLSLVAGSGLAAPAKRKRQPVAQEPIADDVPEMILTSWSFPPGGEMSPLHTCQGGDRAIDFGVQGIVSPPLLWDGVPEGTKSFMVIMEDIGPTDPNALLRPGPEWPQVHWIMFNIPGNERRLFEGKPYDKLFASGAVYGVNSYGTATYRAPCPASGRHQYRFRLYALDFVVPYVRNPTRDRLLKVMRGHILAVAELMGIYERH